MGRALQAPVALDAARLTASESTEATSYVIFRHPHAVDVSNGYSLVVPIVDVATPAREVSVYRAETHARHPLAAIDITNDSGSGLSDPSSANLHSLT